MKLTKQTTHGRRSGPLRIRVPKALVRNEIGLGEATKRVLARLVRATPVSSARSRWIGGCD
jgi:hypothetical protein